MLFNVMSMGEMISVVTFSFRVRALAESKADASSIHAGAFLQQTNVFCHPISTLYLYQIL